MEAYGGQNPAAREQPECVGKGAGNLVELVVDGYAQRLKSAGGGVDLFAVLAGEGTFHGFGEVERRLEPP